MKIKKLNTHYVFENEFIDFSVNFIKEKFLSFSNQKVINIALSGGSTPLPILKKLRNEKIAWEKFNFFLVDERMVSIGSSESNFKNINEVFFKYLSSNSFPILSENYTEEEVAINYEKKIKSLVPISKNGFPKFDMIILGMGEDGHTASLFPNTVALNNSKAIVTLNEVPQLKSTRITLTFPVLMECNSILICLKGKDKIKIVNELKDGVGLGYPISRILESNPTWIISK